MKTLTRPAWDKTFCSAVDNGIVPQIINRVLFFGWPRSGKSTLPGTLWGVDKVCRFTAYDGMPPDDVIGGFTPSGDGKFRWSDGVGTRALREGLPLVIDEIEQACRGEMRFHLHAFMDDPAGLTLPTGERVNAAPGYCVIGTTNLEKPETLPAPIFDRFDMILPVASMSDGLRKALGDLAKPAEAVLGRGGDMITKWTRPATVNLFIAASKLRKHGLSDDHIAEALGLFGQEAADFLTAIAR